MRSAQQRAHPPALATCRLQLRAAPARSSAYDARCCTLRRAINALVNASGAHAPAPSSRAFPSGAMQQHRSCCYSAAALPAQAQRCTQGAHRRATLAAVQRRRRRCRGPVHRAGERTQPRAQPRRRPPGRRAGVASAVPATSRLATRHLLRTPQMARSDWSKKILEAPSSRGVSQVRPAH
jgi:hypothetical protein